jgi:ubiquinone/menaquinone biosynthesis C-methylase UbiE
LISHHSQVHTLLRIRMINYVSPIDQSPLKKVDGGFLDSGGNLYPIKENLPDFTYPLNLSSTDLASLEWYKLNADSYDEYLPLTFETFSVDENLERDKLISKLNLKAGDSVLETGCGSGRDSVKIAELIGPTGNLFLQDISYDILKFTVNKFEKLSTKPNLNISIANGFYLPFENEVFDKVFHFGGLNTFGDKKRAFAEMVRVVKPGGKIVVGDENMPVWLRETEFGKVLMNSNPHYKYDLPLIDLPVEARNVSIEWIIGGVFYVISFEKGIGEPYANYDFKIPGSRGGTHRTRYYGQTEGLTSTTIELIKKARTIRDISLFDWLEEVLTQAANKEINNKNEKI